MEFIADLHIHSRFSRATSKNLSIKNLEKYARIKGIDVLGTGDFCHPEWEKELKRELEEKDGILKTRTGFYFVLSNEISLIYSQAGKRRQVHIILLSPNFEVVEQITEYLKSLGRVDYDGRPIFGVSLPELTENLKQLCNEIEIIPAHIWTPWFGLLGSRSGFDSFEEAFQDQAKHIYSLETGLSSDPPMNWRLSRLDRFSVLSFSDSHSFWPWRIGREATIFDLEKLSYKNIIRAIRKRKGLKATIEVDPSYGKYHFDGHKTCGVVLHPNQTRKLNGICPKCKRQLTVGVLNRVEELADRPEGFVPPNKVNYKTLIPLSEIISSVFGASVHSKTTWSVYNKLIKTFGSEFEVLLRADKNKLSEVVNRKVVDAIIKNREGNIKINPGYDGVYGELIISKGTETKKIQSDLTDF